MSKSIVLVTGATGAQGGGVARHLLSSGEYQVRCLTRHPDSDKAKALASAGAEVVAGDFANRASLDKALEGCSAAFGVTNFWEHFGAEAEQGRNLVDAVAASNVEHFIFSTLPSATKISSGKLKVPHFDIKAELQNYAVERGVPSTFLHMTFYYENFIEFFAPKKQGDGSYAFGFPQGDTPLAAVAVEDGGGIVAAILADRDRFLGKTVAATGEDQPADRYAAQLSKALGVPVAYNHIPREVFASFDFPGAEELADMFEFYRVHIPNRQAELELCREIYPQIQSFANWLPAHKEKIRASMEASA